MKFFGRKTQKQKKIRLAVCLCKDKESGEMIIEKFIDYSGSPLTIRFINYYENELKDFYNRRYSCLKIIYFIETDEVVE